MVWFLMMIKDVLKLWVWMVLVILSNNVLVGFLLLVKVGVINVSDKIKVNIFI